MKKIREISVEEYADCLQDLYLRAFKKSPFDTICTVLRVTGCQDADWDPFEESKEEFEDFNQVLREAEAKGAQKTKWRIGLLMYCHAVEMSAAHSLLANLLRCLNGQKYHLNPLGHLGRSKKKQSFSPFIPPSAKKKFSKIKETAATLGEEKLIEIIDSFFDDGIRNAFVHSDYVLAGNHFRWTETGFAKQVELDFLNVLVKNCFSFYSALLGLHTVWLKALAQHKKFHRWPQYEVLELLSDEEKGLYGFHVHFSNGNKATFSRTEERVDMSNIMIERGGTITFFVGSLDALEPVWKVNGRPFKEDEI